MTYIQRLRSTSEARFVNRYRLVIEPGHLVACVSKMERLEQRFPFIS